METEGSCDLLTTGEMARLSDNSLRVVRHYEQLGLLRTEGRSAGGHRLFARKELKKLLIVNVLRDLGLPLKTIGQLMNAGTHSAEGRGAAAKLSEALHRQLDTIEERITEMRRVRDEVSAARAALDECKHHDAAWADVDCRQCSLMEGEDAPKALKSILV